MANERIKELLADGHPMLSAVAIASAEAERDALAATVARVREATIECAYCNGVGSLLCLPGDVIEPCPACGGLRAALDGSRRPPPHAGPRDDA